MKVHLIKKQTIEDYIATNARSRSSFQDWISKIKFADWTKVEDIKHTFGSADFLGQGSHRVIFDIGGNNYRMICKYSFGENQVHLFICWIGTHTEYTELCQKKKQYTINIY
jgi:mRNA interferase HigB